MGSMQETLLNCALCNEPSPSPIFFSEKPFCCAGCKAVFCILESKNQLDGFKQNPVYKAALQSGLISNQTLLTESQQAMASKQLCLEIPDMWCPACAEVISLVTKQQPGVLRCVVDYATDLASIEYDPCQISKQQLMTAIASFGYSPAELSEKVGTLPKGLWLRFGVAAFCSMNIMMFSYPLYSGALSGYSANLPQMLTWANFALCIPVVTFSAWPIWKRFWGGIKTGLFGMEVLVVLGASCSLALSLQHMYDGSVHVYFDSLAVIITLVLLGKIIEARAKFSAKETLFGLAKSLPRRGRKKMPDGTLSFVPLKDFAPGDVAVAFSGEKIVLDGLMEKGSAYIDESLLTGESKPLHKTEGDTLLGGSVVLSGDVTYTVTRCGEDSLIQRLIDHISQDIGQKTPYVRAADALVKIFVPGVLSLAAATLIWDGSFETVMAVLLISCPCAIGIAAPLAEAHIINHLAASGVIVRNRGVLRLLGQEDVIAFDKTGTLTKGQFAVLKGLENLSKTELAILKGLTGRSIHPIAKAICASIQEAPAELNVTEISGAGLQSGPYQVGSATFTSQQPATGPHTTVFFTKASELLATIVLGDSLKADSQAVIAALGPQRTLLLSGDSEAVVAHIAAACRIPAYKACMHPLEKREVIDSLCKSGKIVCMVGDGINDAPALTRADIGISVVTASEMSIQVSDILLTHDKLTLLPVLQKAGRLARRIVSQNLFWAFIYNIIGLGLAACGLLTPLFASLAMLLSSLAVVGNSKRLRWLLRKG